MLLEQSLPAAGCLRSYLLGYRGHHLELVTCSIMSASKRQKIAGGMASPPKKCPLQVRLHALRAWMRRKDWRKGLFTWKKVITEMKSTCDHKDIDYFARCKIRQLVRDNLPGEELKWSDYHMSQEFKDEYHNHFTKATVSIIVDALLPPFKACLETGWCGKSYEETVKAFQFRVAARIYAESGHDPVIVRLNAPFKPAITLLAPGGLPDDAYRTRYELDLGYKVSRILKVKHVQFSEGSNTYSVFDEKTNRSSYAMAENDTFETLSLSRAPITRMNCFGIIAYAPDCFQRMRKLELLEVLHPDLASVVEGYLLPYSYLFIQSTIHKEIAAHQLTRSRVAYKNACAKHRIFKEQYVP